jgi:hypothetical protein
LLAAFVRSGTEEPFLAMVRAAMAAHIERGETRQ